MIKFIWLQLFILSAVALIFFLFLGYKALFWCFMGGLSYWLPNLIAVIVFKRLLHYRNLSFLALGSAEILKIVLSLIIMATVFAIWHQNILFIPFIIGLFTVSHLSTWFFSRVKYYGK